MTKRHSIQERLVAVTRYLNGEPSTLVAKQTGIDHHDIISYAKRYERDGLAGLEDRPKIHRTSMEKKAVVEEYLRESLTLEEIAFKYETSVGSIKQWVRAYKRNDKEYFRDNKRESYYIQYHMAKSRKDPAEMTKEELQERLKDLEAENALLKKVKALVEKREAQEQKIGSKPSTN